jgi:hypothetical protein
MSFVHEQLGCLIDLDSAGDSPLIAVERQSVLPFIWIYPNYLDFDELNINPLTCHDCRYAS